jgi:hypothetical protein
MSPEAIAAIGVILSLLGNGTMVAISWGRMSQKITGMEEKISELGRHVEALATTKETLASFGSRLGSLEGEVLRLRSRRR